MIKGRVTQVIREGPNKKHVESTVICVCKCVRFKFLLH